MKTSEVFKAAKLNLWDGTGPERSNRYICHAIWDLIRYDQRAIDKATRIIDRAISPYCTLEGWLVARGVNLPTARADRNRAMQAHRHAWLDRLIEQFDAAGD